MKKNRLQRAIFWVYGVWCKGGEYPNIIRDNKQTLLRQITPTGTCGRGIGWGIA